MEIRDVQAFLPYWRSIRGRTRRLLERIPPERVEWAPAEGAFGFGDLVRHLAGIERWMFAENVHGRPSRYPGHGRELAEGLEGVLAYLDRMHADTIEVLAELDAEALQRPCTTPAGTSLPTWKWLRAMVEHEVHHRGQAYLMLRMLEVPTPPLYGLTEEEVRARSEPPR